MYPKSSSRIWTCGRPFLGFVTLRFFSADEILGSIWCHPWRLEKGLHHFFLPQGGTVTKLKCIMMFIWCRNDECVFHFRCGVDLLLCHFHTSSIIRCAIRLLQNWGPCLFTSILTGCANFSSRSRVHTCWVDSLISRVPNLKIILGKPLEIDGFWT